MIVVHVEPVYYTVIHSVAVRGSRIFFSILKWTRVVILFCILSSFAPFKFFPPSHRLAVPLPSCSFAPSSPHLSAG